MKKLYACMAAILMAATTVSAQNPVAPAALQRAQGRHVPGGSQAGAAAVCGEIP